MQFRNIQLPKNLLDRLRLILPGNKFDSVVHTFSIRRATTIRTNILKIKGMDLRRQLIDDGIKLDTVFWYKDAFIVRNKSLKELRSLKYYKDGYFYVQSLSSMIAPLVLDPNRGEKILDIAAAPGSKTTQMASIMRNTGEIIANEPNIVRRQKLAANLIIQGINNTKVISERGEMISSIYSDYFDKALVDAPCSGEGRISKFYRDSYQYWSIRNVHNFSHLQKRLLISALLAVKPGGIVVYSTCTLSPEENEAVVSHVLEKSQGLVKTEPIFVNSFQFAPSFKSWEEKTYHKGVENAVRIYPSNTMEGFFIAKLRKVGR